MGANHGRNFLKERARVNRGRRFRRAMAGFTMVPACPFQSLVPRFSADSLVRLRELYVARVIILFKRLQFFMPLLGRNRLDHHEKQTSQSAEEEGENNHRT